jgi:hypothetical protein
VIRHVRELEVGSELSEGFGSWTLRWRLGYKGLLGSVLVKRYATQEWSVSYLAEICFASDSSIKSGSENGSRNAYGEAKHEDRGPN